MLSLSLSLRSPTTVSRFLCSSSILLMLLPWQLLLPAAETRPLPSPTSRWALQLLQALPKGPVVPSGPSACTHSPDYIGARKCPVKLSRAEAGASLDATHLKATPPPPS